jgi:hypothetical protein
MAAQIWLFSQSKSFRLLSQHCCLPPGWGASHEVGLAIAFAEEQMVETEGAQTAPIVTEAMP